MGAGRFLIWIFCFPMTAAVIASFSAVRHYAAIRQPVATTAWGCLCVGFTSCWIAAAAMPFFVSE